jgi:hypothetical protein
MDVAIVVVDYAVQSRCLQILGQVHVAVSKGVSIFVRIVASVRFSEGLSLAVKLNDVVQAFEIEG